MRDPHGELRFLAPLFLELSFQRTLFVCSCLVEWGWLPLASLPGRMDVLLFAAGCAAIMHCYRWGHVFSSRHSVQLVRMLSMLLLHGNCAHFLCTEADWMSPKVVLCGHLLQAFQT